MYIVDDICIFILIALLMWVHSFGTLGPSGASP